MSEKPLKIVPAPEAKTAPDEAPAADEVRRGSAQLGRKRLRMILLVGAAGARRADRRSASISSGGRYISTDNAYVGAQKVLITPDISGKVIHVAVREGQHVKAGDELFDDRSASRSGSRSTQAQGQARAARTDYDKLKTNLASLSHAGRSRAEERRAQAARRRAQDARWSKSQAGSQADVDTAAAGAGDRAAAGAVRQAAARHHAQPVARQSRPADREISRPTRRPRPRSTRRSAISTTPSLRAPIAGIATQVDNIQLGRFVTAGTPVFSVIDDSAPWVDANPKETDITYLRVGQKATIDVDTLPGPHLPRHRACRSAPAPARNSRSCRRRTPAATGSRWCSACRCASPSTRTRTRACCAPA